MECVLPERNYSGEAMTDTTELRRAAEAATPGPWCAFISSDVSEVQKENNHRDAVVHWSGFDAGDLPKRQRPKDALFIALANPATILALLDEREKLLKVVDAAKESCHVNFSGGFVAIRDALKELEK